MRFAGPSELRPSRSLDVAVAAVRGARIDEAAERHRRAVVEFCAEHPDALHRSCGPGHLTASAAVLESGTGRFALMLHARVGRWLQPGGHADGEANLARVSLVEAAEETGIEGLAVVTPAVDVDVHVFRAPAEPEHLHLDLRHLVVAPRGAELAGNRESRDLRWVAHDDLGHLDLDPGIHRLAASGTAVAEELDVL